MAYYQRGAKSKKIYHSPYVIVGILIVAVFLAISAFPFYDAYRTTRQKRDEARAKLEELTAHKTEVLQELGDLDTPEGTERILREKYRVGKEGEGVVVITDPTPVVATDAPPKTGVAGFFERLFSSKK